MFGFVYRIVGHKRQPRAVKSADCVQLCQRTNLLSHSTISRPLDIPNNPSMAETLRDFVASELGKLPGSRTLTLHALVSTPQREIELFPYAQAPKNFKITSQNILLLVSEAAKPVSTDSSDATNAPNILVSALEATLYLFPGTSSSILYIGKVDTTGFSNVAPSPARTLARATIDYYVRPDTRPVECGQRVWVHLFARAQSQYLFPDSADWKAKRVLGDAGLVRWWWSLFGDIARDVAGAQKDQQGAMSAISAPLPPLTVHPPSWLQGHQAMVYSSWVQ